MKIYIRSGIGMIIIGALSIGIYIGWNYSKNRGRKVKNKFDCPDDVCDAEPIKLVHSLQC